MLEFILIYVTGYMASYFMLKATLIEGNGEFILSDKIQCLVVALISWLGFLLSLILYGLEKYDKKVKW